MTPEQHERFLKRLAEVATAMKDAACYSPPDTAERLVRAAALVAEARALLSPVSVSTR